MRKDRVNLTCNIPSLSTLYEFCQTDKSDDEERSSNQDVASIDF